MRANKTSDYKVLVDKFETFLDTSPEYASAVAIQGDRIVLNGIYSNKVTLFFNKSGKLEGVE